MDIVVRGKTKTFSKELALVVVEKDEKIGRRPLDVCVTKQPCLEAREGTSSWSICFSILHLGILEEFLFDLRFIYFFLFSLAHPCSFSSGKFKNYFLSFCEILNTCLNFYNG